LYYSFSGSLDSAGLVVTGQWELYGSSSGYAGGSGPFSWRMSPEHTDQFTGNLEKGKFQFCGWRDGSKRPIPCEWP
jgi:hypothetical protein